MILDVIRASSLSAWLMELVTAEGAEDPTPALDRLGRYQDELAGAILEHVRGLPVPAKAARKWLQMVRHQPDPPAGAVAEARQQLQVFVHLILPQILYDPGQLRD